MSKVVQHISEVSPLFLAELARWSGDKFFSIQWEKNDGTTRKVVARFIKPAPDAKPATTEQNKYLLIWVVGKGYRSVRKDTIQAVNAKGICAYYK